MGCLFEVSSTVDYSTNWDTVLWHHMVERYKTPDLLPQHIFLSLLLHDFSSGVSL